MCSLRSVLIGFGSSSQKLTTTSTIHMNTTKWPGKLILPTDRDWPITAEVFLLIEQYGISYFALVFPLLCFVIGLENTSSLAITRIQNWSNRDLVTRVFRRLFPILLRDFIGSLRYEPVLWLVYCHFLVLVVRISIHGRSMRQSVLTVMGTSADQ